MQDGLKEMRERSQRADRKNLREGVERICSAPFPSQCPAEGREPICSHIGHISHDSISGEPKMMERLEVSKNLCVATSAPTAAALRYALRQKITEFIGPTWFDSLI
jgi:hypothetical protein